MAKREGSVQLGFYVPTDQAQRLRGLSERTMIPQSRLLRRALELLFESYEAQAKTRGKARKQ